jgi:S1-C subfamily serine protease
MRSTALIFGLFTLAIGAQAQDEAPAPTPAPTPRASNYRFVRTDDMGDRAVLGVNTSGGSKRDTLGLLISSVTPGGPAEKAGLTEGDRIVSVNGTSLKVAPGDAGEPEMGGMMSRRLVRTMSNLKAGDEVTLVIYSNGSTKTVKVKTIAMDDLNDGSMKKKSGDRAVVGVGFGGGSKRDTLGLFIESVTAGGPADKAGIQEGMRIASINGVDMRISAADAEDGSLVWAKQERFTRVLRELNPGDAVELKVWADGGWKTYKVTTVKSSDLYGKYENAWTKYAEGMAGFAPKIRMDMAPMPPMPPMPPMGPMAIPPMRMKMSPGESTTMTCNTVGDGTVVCQSTGKGKGSGNSKYYVNPDNGRGASRAPMAMAYSGGDNENDNDNEINFPGLRMTTVTPELASYFGAGSENGLLVLEASDDWSPVKTGDVVLTLNGRAVVRDKTTSVSLDTGRDNTFVVLRKGKKISVVVKAR